MNLLTTVWVEHRFTGFHRWAGAPDARGYLRALHRHSFHVHLELEVGHEDREVEFHDLLDFVVQLCATLGDGAEGYDDDAHVRHLDRMSCEAIATRILEAVLERWPLRLGSCTVSEDGEVGATVQVM